MEAQSGFRYRVAGKTPAPTASASRRHSATLRTFLILICLWIILSGRFDPFHLSLGLISCAIVSLFSGDLLGPEVQTGELSRSWLRFLRYLPWLFYQILLANLHMLYLVFHPRMRHLIDPRIIEFKSRLNKELALVTFANSITLTPGTITVYVSIDGNFKVHAIDRKSAQALPGRMQVKVGRAFAED